MSHLKEGYGLLTDRVISGFRDDILYEIQTIYLVSEVIVIHKLPTKEYGYKFHFRRLQELISTNVYNEILLNLKHDKCNAKSKTIYEGKVKK